MKKSAFSIDQNVIIKEPLPKQGIVSSNPERAKRLAAHFLENPKQIVESWGVGIILGTVKNGAVNSEFFFAYVPMGASGSAHAFHEIFAAGATELVRLGSNDVWVEAKDIDSLILVSEARGLRGLAWDHGINEDAVDIPILPSGLLQQSIIQSCHRSAFSFSERVCFNVDDYHGYLYPDLMEHSNRIKERLAFYETFAPYCRDMETASLFLKAKQFGTKVASVLQNVIKQKKGLPYAGTSGEKAKADEIKIAQIIINALLENPSVI